MRLLLGDALDQLRTLPVGAARCCVTSPPYFGLRDYGVAGQLGAEATPDEYAARLVAVMAEVRRVLTPDGTLWLNLGDAYANNASTSAIPRAEQGNGSGVFAIPPEKHHEARRQDANRLTPLKAAGLKHKDLLGIPWLVAFALRADGWYLRSEIIWAKPNPMPESVTDRPTKSHEHLFLLARSEHYYYDAAAIAEPVTDEEYRTVGKVRPSRDAHFVADPVRGATKAGLWNQPGGRATRNRRDVWTVPTQPYPGAHFATFPPALVRPCILAGSAPGDTVLDPFVGSGTTLSVAKTLGRDGLGIDLNPAYLDLARARLDAAQPPLFVEWPEPMAAD